MAWEYSKIDKQVITRWKKLGDLGEFMAETLLAKKGFTDIRNLNKESKNKIYADIFCIRNKQPYVISVKARNKYENTGRLNSRYKLGQDCYKKAHIIEKEYKAKAAWVTIAIDVDNETYDAFFGLLDSLHGNTGVVMTPDATNKYDCLALHERLEDIGITKEVFQNLKNKYNKK